MANTVHVKDISHETSEKDVRDFFSFCGKITSLSVTPTSDATDATKSATVTFEKETAAKTALLLDNTKLGPAQVHVSSAASLEDIAGSNTAGSAEESKDGHDVEQEDKPRSRILAEYLAHGYVVSDKAIERAIALDRQHGISNRFTKALQDFDQRTKATQTAQAMDAKYGVSGRADAAWRGMTSYFDKALGTPTGQRLRQFYEQGNKNVMDVHNEARHLANLKSGRGQPQEVPETNRTELESNLGASDEKTEATGATPATS
ncbi:MAG: hypothetical protein M1821_001289 [Bathelium mastoideum]|nr:MAG: hypothetical protein M1821_001289 [Bathelium mastoideum]KAI9689810.1 MAG: hypothetical protein M1822_009692 [Bathelium mastoideum]